MQTLRDSWEFVKRHKGKIAAGTAVVGSAFAFKKAYDAELLAHVCQSPRLSEQEQQLRSARRHFVFDTHQQSCEKALVEAIGDVRLLLRQRFPVDELVDQLKEPNLEPADKIRLWEDVKQKAIARIVATAFAYALVIVATKTQNSIICAETCKVIDATRGKHDAGIFSKLSDYVFGESASSSATTTVDPKVQQVFFNCIQFLTTSGLNQLFARVEGCVESSIGDYALNKKVTVADFEALFDRIVEKVNKEVGSRNFSDLIIPVTNVQTHFTGDDASNLEALLIRFVSLFQLPTCRQLMSLFVGRFTYKAIEFMNGEVGDVEQPLAKFLPLLADSFKVEARSNHDSAFQDCLHSHELHQFTLMAFGGVTESGKPNLAADDFGLD